MLTRVLLNPTHPMERDNRVITLTLLTTIILPVGLLYFAGRVLLTHNCAN